MTENINPYRVIPESETYANHCFYTMRHFPELSTGINTILTSTSRKDSETTKLRRRKTKASSSRILSQFCRSSVEELTAVKDFHQTLIESRLAQKSSGGVSVDSRSSQSENTIYGRSIETNSTPLSTANEKLMKVAVRYENLDRGREEIKGFEGMMMTMDEFDKQLKRGLHIWLTRPELEALFAIMHKTEGVHGEAELLDPEAFLTYFFQSGYRARQLHRQNSLISKQTSSLEFRHKKALSASETSSVEYESPSFMATECSSADLETALEKLRCASFALDLSSNLHAMRLRMFQCRLTPMQFRLQLERSFALALTDAEAAALVVRYSTLSAPHCIDGHYFVHTLLPLKQEVKLRDKQKQSKLAAVRHSLVNDRNQAESISKVLGR